MINEELREKMGQAFEQGRFDEALELSRKMDEEILKFVKQKLNCET